MRRPCRSAARSTSVPGAGRDTETEAVGVDDEVGVPRLLAEAPVEPVRELGRPHRAEPVGERDVLGRPEADVAEQPLAAAPASTATSSAGSRSGRAPSSRPVTRSSPRGPIRRIERTTRPCAAGQRGGRRLVARHPADVDAADRRPGGNRPALGQGNAGERRRHEHDHAGERRPR